MPDMPMVNRRFSGHFHVGRGSLFEVMSDAAQEKFNGIPHCTDPLQPSRVISRMELEATDRSTDGNLGGLVSHGDSIGAASGARGR
jgi:hypothetical protein